MGRLRAHPGEVLAEVGVDALADGLDLGLEQAGHKRHATAAAAT